MNDMDYITALNENLTNYTCCLSQTKLITFPNTHTNTHLNPLTNTNYPKSHYNQNKHSTLTNLQPKTLKQPIVLSHLNKRQIIISKVYFNPKRTAKLLFKKTHSCYFKAPTTISWWTRNIKQLLWNGINFPFTSGKQK